MIVKASFDSGLTYDEFQQVVDAVVPRAIKVIENATGQPTSLDDWSQISLEGKFEMQFRTKATGLMVEWDVLREWFLISLQGYKYKCIHVEIASI